MLVISGLWIAILPKMAWCSIELKKLNIAYYCIGIYISLLGVLLRMIDMKINDDLLVLALTTSILLVICTIILKLKGEKNIIDILAIVTSVVLLICAITVAIIEIDETAITMITGALLLLSISYKSVSKSC